MLHQQIQRNGYIQIEEDILPTSSTSTPRVIQLRNVAYTIPPRSLTRSEVLESLVPLSRTPWGLTPSIMAQDALTLQQKQQRRQSA